MTYRLAFVNDVPDVAAFEALLMEYYTGILPMFEAVSGIRLDPADMVKDSIAHLPDMLPPNGRLLLAHSDTGHLVGCGTLRRIGTDAAEMKRMFVRPEARGTGLGRQIFELRLSEAEAMGCKTVYADTVKGNEVMLAMYRRYGFQSIERYPGNGNSAEFAPSLEFLEYRF